MNFISQSLSNLTSGGKLYVLFQIVYLLGAIFFTYVQVQILKALKGEETSIIIASSRMGKYYVKYKLDGSDGSLVIVSTSSNKAKAHLQSLYPDATDIVVLGGSNENN